MERTKALRKNPLFGYFFALTAFAASISLRFLLKENLAGYPFIAFLPAIVLTAFVAGAGPGALVGTLSLGSAVYFFMPPYNSFAISNPTDLLAISFFAFVIIVILSLTEKLHQKNDALDEANNDRQRLINYQQILFAELQHRVANNLAFVSAILALQKRELDVDSVAAKALEMAGSRVMTLSRVHRTLYDQASLDQSLTIFLKQLTLDVMNAAGSQNATLEVLGDDIHLDMDRLTTVALLVSELVTNCAKHVLLKGLGNKITVTVKRLDETQVQIQVSDNGPGLPLATADVPKGEKLGQAIIAGLVKQLTGSYETINQGGAVAVITFPAQEPSKPNH